MAESPHLTEVLPYTLEVQFWCSLLGGGVFGTPLLRLNQLNSISHHRLSVIVRRRVSKFGIGIIISSLLDKAN